MMCKKCLFCFLVVIVFSSGLKQKLESEPSVYITPGDDIVIANVGETVSFTCTSKNLPEKYNFKWVEEINGKTRLIGGINSTLEASSLTYVITDNAIVKLSCVLEHQININTDLKINHTAVIRIIGTEDSSTVAKKPPITYPANIKAKLNWMCLGQNINYDSYLTWYHIKNGHKTELTSNQDSDSKLKLSFSKILDEDDNATIVYCEQNFETLTVKIRSAEYKIILSTTPDNSESKTIQFTSAVYAKFLMRTDSHYFLESTGTSTSFIVIISAVIGLIAIILLAIIIYCCKNHYRKKEPIYAEPKESHYVILQLPPSSSEISGKKDMPPYCKVVGVINPKKNKKVAAELETSNYS